MSNDAADASEVLRAWNRCHGAFYQIQESDLRWNLREQDWLRYFSGHLDGVPVLWGETAAKGEALGLHAGGLWLSFFGEVKTGREKRFVEAIEDFARKSGRKRIAIGGDDFHFLPGLPVEDDSGKKIAEALTELGFSAYDCADFVGAPANPQSAEYIRAARAEAGSRGWSFAELGGHRDREDLDDFLAREFPGRWTREWRGWRDRRDAGRAFWNLLRDEKGALLGFSRLGCRGRHEPFSEGWNPGALRLPLAAEGGRKNTDSCLGPIGIAASERGRGAGKILLGLSLHELSLQGAELTCVDWTNAYNYYTPLGFSIVRRYVSFWKNL